MELNLFVLSLAVLATFALLYFRRRIEWELARWRFKSSASMHLVGWTLLALAVVLLVPLLYFRLAGPAWPLALLFLVVYLMAVGPTTLWYGLAAWPAAFNYLRSRNALGVPFIAMVLGAGSVVLVQISLGGNWALEDTLLASVITGAIGFLIGWIATVPGWVFNV